MKRIIYLVMMLFLFPAICGASEVWKVTAYCSCKKCCGPKSNNTTASGRRCKTGYVALNWLPFGTKILVNGIQMVVMDRGAESLFGTYYHKLKKKKHPKYIKHIDIWMQSHEDALRFGCKYLPVEIIK